MVTGLLLLAAALFLTVYNYYDSRRAGEEAFEVADELIPILEEAVNVQRIHQEEQPQEMPDYKLFPDIPMPEQEIKDTYYLGILEIPSLGLSLPIQSRWAYEALRKSPARYSGSAYSKDLIIAGHNYTSHFRFLRKMAIGEKVYLTDADGNIFTYTLAWTEILNEDQTEAMLEDTDWDMTLFTCTYGGKQRYTLRFVEE